MTVGDLMQMMAAIRFEHRWLAEEFVAESLRLGEQERGKEHHYVPRMYLKRWAVDKKVQPVLVDRRQVSPPQRPKEVAKKTNLYSLPAPDSTMDQPLRWIEKHLSRIEDECADRLDQLACLEHGVVLDDELKRDMSVFLGLQVTRTVSNRERSLLLINGPIGAKREFYRRMGVSEAAFDTMLANTYTDPKVEAINLMFADVRYTVAGSLYRREWAVYRTSEPIVTCDDPVVFVAGPPGARDVTVGALFSAAVLYPISPEHLLVMLRPDLRHNEPYLLNQAETRSANHEIVAAAASTAFERPGDDIAVHLEVPVRAQAAELDDDQVAQLDDVTALRLLLDRVTPRSRWAGVPDAPGWPVPRWYTG
ncbi:DUF4238 domain-containing protein [Rhodococcus opacus]|uniref:DUF4238 domain-containing protein n=1 Tax=Rhodococcus opacus TaxID=37919 RepID=A0A076EYT0_RHOOP|nr:DUF4238 domain-containing protein [Rhodococcus opacus]AII10402.1 hypothetical protein EP51_39555 [Rhodococcus opacus]